MHLVVMTALLTGAGPGSQAAEVSRAEQLFERGEDAFRRGDLVAARRLLTEAYRLDENPVLLYNLARIEETDGRDADALRYYEEYLRRFPRAEYRALVARRVAVLRTQVEQRARMAADAKRYRGPPRPSKNARVLATPKPPKEVGTDSVAGPAVLCSVGAAGIVAGVVMGVFAQQRFDEADGSMSQQQAASRFSTSEDFALGANAAYAAGGTLLLAGALWWIIEASAD